MNAEQIKGTVTISTQDYHGLLDQRQEWQRRLDEQRERDLKTIQLRNTEIDDLKAKTRYYLNFLYDNKMEAWRPHTFYLGSKVCKENDDTVFEIKELQNLIARFDADIKTALQLLEDEQKKWSESLLRFNDGSWSNVWHAIKLFFKPKLRMK